MALKLLSVVVADSLHHLHHLQGACFFDTIINFWAGVTQLYKKQYCATTRTAFPVVIDSIQPHDTTALHKTWNVLVIGDLFDRH